MENRNIIVFLNFNDFLQRLYTKQHIFKSNGRVITLGSVRVTLLKNRPKSLHLILLKKLQ